MQNPDLDWTLGTLELTRSGTGKVQACLMQQTNPSPEKRIIICQSIFFFLIFILFILLFLKTHNEKKKKRKGKEKKRSTSYHTDVALPHFLSPTCNIDSLGGSRMFHVTSSTFLLQVRLCKPPGSSCACEVM